MTSFTLVPGEVYIGGERYDLCSVQGCRIWSDKAKCFFSDGKHYCKQHFYG